MLIDSHISSKCRHGKLKGSNVLIFQTEIGKFPRAKLSDFGLINAQCFANELLDARRFTSSECACPGTSMSPGLRKCQDIYDVGLLTWYTVTGDEEMDPFSIKTAKSEDMSLISLMAKLPDDTPENVRACIEKATRDMHGEQALDDIETMLRNTQTAFEKYPVAIAPGCSIEPRTQTHENSPKVIVDTKLRAEVSNTSN